MLSVLIPTYNYNVQALVEDVYNQLLTLEIDFEILCLEDGSKDKYIKENKIIDTYKNTTHLISKNNLGRIKARQYLSDKANFSWLLFLDADVIPKKHSFISEYKKFFNLEYDAVFGGFTYKNTKPHKNYMLRWTYGSQNEAVSSKTRNKNPYKVIISANFLIKKRVFSFINSQISGSNYGFDNYFGALLKLNKVNIYHTDNAVEHLGLETNSYYLSKKEAAAITLLTLYNSGKILKHSNSLLNLFSKLKKYKLNYFFALIHRLFKNSIKRNILGSKPSIKLLQLYRISYMCYQDLK